MARTVKRLMNLEIDEVSLVDTPANQHGLVAIAKSYQEDNMPVYDAEGQEVFEDELSHGDTVYDESGQEYTYVEGEVNDDDDGLDEGDEGEEVGKARVPIGPLRRGDVVGRVGRAARNRLGDEKLATQMFVGRHRARAERVVGPRVTEARVRGREARDSANRAGRRARGTLTAAGMQYRALPVEARFGLTAGGGAAAGYGYSNSDRRKVRKSLGEEVLVELSKALTEDDRDQVIAKALDRFEDISKRNEELEELVVGIIEQQRLEGFGEVAKSYGLGAEEDIAGLLHRASQVMDEEDVQLLDQILGGAGEIAKNYFDELGVMGGAPSTSLDEVFSTASEAVAKNAELGLTEEQAVVAVLAANPAAYDEYEAEQRYLR